MRVTLDDINTFNELRRKLEERAFEILSIKQSTKEIILDDNIKIDGVTFEDLWVTIHAHEAWQYGEDRSYDFPITDLYEDDFTIKSRSEEIVENKKRKKIAEAKKEEDRKHDQEYQQYLKLKDKFEGSTE